MAFKINDVQQYSLTDSFSVLTSREQKALENSWAKVFADDIFPAIDEEPFRVLYSERTQSRSNTPVNICIGAMIIKEMFQISDDEIVESLMLDIRFQYALHMNEAGNRILECPAGHRPRSSSCSTNGNGHIYASFFREQCLNCPHKEQCRAKVHKNVCSVTISAKGTFRAKTRRLMGSDEFRMLVRIRNGAETIPSMLRRIYGTDRMTVRGLIKTRLYFGCKVAALNVRKLFTFRSGRGHYAQNPLLMAQG